MQFAVESFATESTSNGVCNSVLSKLSILAILSQNPFQQVSHGISAIRAVIVTDAIELMVERMATCVLDRPDHITGLL